MNNEINIKLTLDELIELVSVTNTIVEVLPHTDLLERVNKKLSNSLPKGSIKNNL